MPFDQTATQHPTPAAIEAAKEADAAWNARLRYLENRPAHRGDAITRSKAAEASQTRAIIGRFLAPAPIEARTESLRAGLALLREVQANAEERMIRVIINERRNRDEAGDRAATFAFAILERAQADDWTRQDWVREVVRYYASQGHAQTVLGWAITWAEQLIAGRELALAEARADMAADAA